MVVSADHARVDVAIFIDLRAAHESHIHVAALEIVRENIIHTHHRKRAAYQSWVTNGQWQTHRFGADHACFIDHDKIRRVCPLCEIAGEIWLTNSYKNRIAIA